MTGFPGLFLPARDRDSRPRYSANNSPSSDAGSRKDRSLSGQNAGRTRGRSRSRRPGESSSPKATWRLLKRHSSPRSIQGGGHRADKLRQAITRLPGEERNNFRRALESEPLETITNFFPDCAHGASVSTLRVGREWGGVAVALSSRAAQTARDPAAELDASTTFGRTMPVLTRREVLA